MEIEGDWDDRMDRMDFGGSWTSNLVEWMGMGMDGKSRGVWVWMIE